MNDKLAKYERRLNRWLKKNAAPLHSVLRAMAEWCKRRKSYHAAKKRYQVNQPLDDRMHLAALCRVLSLKGEGVEIGVLMGYFSELILIYSDLSVLHSVDPWQAFDSDSYDDSSNAGQSEMDRRYQFTQDRLQRYGQRSRIHRATSADAAPQFADNTLDFVFIDANHSYEPVKEDIELWWPKLKPGGIFAGHDYLDGHIDGSDFGVKQAVDEFATAHQQTVFVIKAKWPSWYVIKE